MLLVVAASGFAASGFGEVPTGGSDAVDTPNVTAAVANRAGLGQGIERRVRGAGAQPVGGSRSGGASTVVGQRGGRLETSPGRGHGVAVLGDEPAGRDDLLRTNGRRINADVVVVYVIGV